MEFITGDHPTPTDAVHFPNNLTSFPRNSKADISHMEINPPNSEFLQVNFTGPYLAHFSNSGQDLDQNLLGCADELGFLAQLACQDGHEVFNVNRLADQNDGSPPLLQMITDSKVDITSHSQASFLKAELSLSDDDWEVSEASEEALNQEKRRMKMPKLKVFLQNLIVQVMQKQEQMHKQLMDIVEKKEKERIILEEAWKKQEVERAKVDEEERKQETLRSLALISFIQKLSYQNFEAPYSPESSDRGNHNCVNDDSSNRRWPKTEVQALITVRMAVDQKFLIKGAKGSGWKEVAAGLANMGYNRTPEKCREKWENINKYYRRTMESGKKRQRSLPYFDELDLIHKRGLLSQGNANS